MTRARPINLFCRRCCFAVDVDAGVAGSVTKRVRVLSLSFAKPMRNFTAQADVCVCVPLCRIVVVSSLNNSPLPMLEASLLVACVSCLGHLKQCGIPSPPSPPLLWLLAAIKHRASSINWMQLPTDSKGRKSRRNYTTKSIAFCCLRFCWLPTLRLSPSADTMPMPMPLPTSTLTATATDSQHLSYIIIDMSNHRNQLHHHLPRHHNGWDASNE